MRKIPLVFFIFALNSCEWDIKESVKQKEQKPSWRQIVFEKEVGSTYDLNFLVMSLQEEGHLKLVLRGTHFIPEFSQVYTKDSQSVWEEEECHEALSIPVCQWNIKRGSCRSQFRDYLGEREEKIGFENSNQIRLAYQVGDKTYPLGEILEHDNEKVIFGVEITPEMVRDSKELQLIVLPDPNEKDLSVGFVGYLYCEGQGQKNFNPHISTQSSRESSGVEVHYRVDFYWSKK